MIRFRSVVVAAAFFMPLAAPRPAAAQTPADTAAILQTMQALFDAMAARDSVALASVITRDGGFAAVVVRGDSVAVMHSRFDRFIARIGTGGPALLERAWQPRVLIDGPLAVVWTSYDFHVDGRFSHCGTDAFTLAKIGGAWRITGGSYTIVPEGCAPSPLGEP